MSPIPCGPGLASLLGGYVHWVHNVSAYVLVGGSPSAGLCRFPGPLDSCCLLLAWPGPLRAPLGTLLCPLLGLFALPWDSQMPECAKSKPLRFGGGFPGSVLALPWLVSGPSWSCLVLAWHLLGGFLAARVQNVSAYVLVWGSPSAGLCRFPGPLGSCSLFLACPRPFQVLLGTLLCTLLAPHVLLWGSWLLDVS